MIIINNLSFSEIASFGVAFALIFASVAAIIYIIKGGISAILAGDDAEKRKEALYSIRYSVVGLVVVFFAVVIVKIVGAIFGLNLTQYLDFNEVSKMFDIIMRRLNGDYSDLNGANTNVLDF